MNWLVLALIASVLKAFANISEKEILKKEDATIYASAFSLVIAFASVPLLFFVGPINLSGVSLTTIYITSLISIISSITAAYSIKKLDISESTGLFALSPILVTLFAVVFINESLVPFQILGIALSALGVYVIEHNFSYHSATGIPINIKDENITKSKTGTYILLAISVTAFSISTVADRHIVHNLAVSPLLYLVIGQFFLLFNFILFDMALLKTMHKKVIDPKLFLQLSFWVNIILIICHRITHVLALVLVEISVLNAIKQINAVFTAIIGGKLFTEKHILRRTLGCVCIAMGVAIVAIWTN